MSNEILARVVRLLDEGLVVPAPSLMKLRYPDSTERVWGQSQQSLAGVGIGTQEAKLTDSETLIRDGMRRLEIKGEPPSSQMVLLLQEMLPLVKEKILTLEGDQPSAASSGVSAVAAVAEPISHTVSHTVQEAECQVWGAPELSDFAYRLDGTESEASEEDLDAEDPENIREDPDFD